MSGVDLKSVRPGFADESAGSQAVFRVALEALSHPGRVLRVPAACLLPRHGQAAAATLLLALLDAECSVWLSASLRATDAADWLRFHTGCRLEQDRLRRLPRAVRDLRDRGAVIGAVWRRLAPQRPGYRRSPVAGGAGAGPRFSSPVARQPRCLSARGGPVPVRRRPAGRAAAHHAHRRWRDMRRSELVTVPSFSPQASAGSFTLA